MSDLESDHEHQETLGTNCSLVKDLEESPVNEPNSFVKTINELVAKYLRLCKYNSTQISIFQKYLSYGGIDLDKNKTSDSEIGSTQKADFLFTIHQFFLDHFINDPYYISIEQHKEAPNVIRRFVEYLLEQDKPLLVDYKEQLLASVVLLKKIEDELVKSKFFALGIPGKYDYALSVQFGGANYNAFKNIDKDDLCLDKEEMLKEKEECDKLSQEYIERFDIKPKLNSSGHAQTPPVIRHLDMKVVGYNEQENLVRLEETILNKNDKRVFRNEPRKFILLIDSGVSQYLVLGSVLIGSFICIKEDGDNSLYYVNSMSQILPPFSLEEY